MTIFCGSSLDIFDPSILTIPSYPWSPTQSADDVMRHTASRDFSKLMRIVGHLMKQAKVLNRQEARWFIILFIPAQSSCAFQITVIYQKYYDTHGDTVRFPPQL